MGTRNLDKQVERLLAPRESSIEIKLKRIVVSHKGLCLKFVSPGTRGVPDRAVYMPGGKHYLVETKRPKFSRTNEMQHALHALFLGLGFKIRVIHTEEQLKDFENEISAL